MRRALDEAITAFLEADDHLLAVNANERSMTHRLACHLGPRVGDYHVDCEYNRNDKLPKILYEAGVDERNVLPDIIVHRRGTATNKLVVEAKKSDAARLAIEDDGRKLNAFINYLGYDHAALVIFRVKPGPTGVEIRTWI